MSPADREMQARLHQLQRDRTTAAKGEIPDQDGLRAALARRAATTGGQKRIQAHAQARARRRSPPPPPPPRLMVPDGLLNRSGGALWWLGLANGSAGWDACAAHVAAQRWHTKQRRRPGMSNAKLGCVARYMPPRSLAKRLLREPGTMVGRVGSIEAMGMVHLGSSDGGHSVSVRTLLQQNAGVFTTRVADRMPVMRRFFDEYGHAMVESDLEMLVADHCPAVLHMRCRLSDASARHDWLGDGSLRALSSLAPLIHYYTRLSDWLELLTELARARTDLLVVTAFPRTIRAQLPRLRHIHPAHDLSGLRVRLLAAPQSFQWNLRDATDVHWAAALDRLAASPVWRGEGRTVALLSCGAYGLPLARHAKARKISAVYVGGLLPLLFGVHGKRYRDGPWAPVYNGSFNEHWVSPLREETPAAGVELVEGGAYWR